MSKTYFLINQATNKQLHGNHSILRNYISLCFMNPNIHYSVHKNTPMVLIMRKKKLHYSTLKTEAGLPETPIPCLANCITSHHNDNNPHNHHCENQSPPPLFFKMHFNILLLFTSKSSKRFLSLQIL